jgi:hypothetical protein
LTKAEKKGEHIASSSKFHECIAGAVSLMV